MKLHEITPGLSLAGVEPTQIVSVIATVPLGDGAVQLIYRTQAGGMKERLLGSADAASISVATVERPFSFDGDGAAFQLTCEAKRIDLAFLFDPMMAVHTSNVDALPHQITAVYESMLPRQPLRFVLADDPGAGKTIMAGLYIRELIMRADARRILVVAPGSLRVCVILRLRKLCEETQPFVLIKLLSGLVAIGDFVAIFHWHPAETHGKTPISANHIDDTSGCLPERNLFRCTSKSLQFHRCLAVNMLCREL